MPAKAILPVCLFCLFLGCDYPDRITRLEKENKDLQTQVSRQQAAIDYDLQAKCSRDAKAWFNENWNSSDKNTLLLHYINHYHKPRNKCYILVEYHYSIGDKTASWVNHMSVYDMYENTEYGSFSENHMIYYKPEVRTEDRVFVCKFLRKECKSLEEFNGLISPYLND